MPRIFVEGTKYWLISALCSLEAGKRKRKARMEEIGFQIEAVLSKSSKR